MHFEAPWSFLLLLFIPLLLLSIRKRGKRSSVRFSSIGNVAAAGRSMRQRLAFLPTLFRVLALICLITALARPQIGKERVRDISKGIAIEMVIDRSSSMSAEMEFKGQKKTRLDVVKQVFEDFVMGNGHDLEGRPNDLIGMVSFARYPDTICPLTLAHGALMPFLKNVKLVQIRSEDGTAIGDALSLAAARLRNANETVAKQRERDPNAYQIKSKAIILLSDGENNYGKRDPLEAAELAKKWGIKVYTIAITGESVTSVQQLFGVFKIPMGDQIDTKVLESIASKTGGFFRKAEDADSLYAIYREIDQMEKSEIESVRFMDYKEAFLGWALAGLLLIVVEISLNATLFRKTP